MKGDLGDTTTHLQALQLTLIVKLMYDRCLDYMEGDDLPGESKILYKVVWSTLMKAFIMSMKAT